MASVISGNEASAAEPKPIKITSCNYTAVTPNRTYVLVGDLECPGRGILVEADNVEIDLRGFTLSGGNDGLPAIQSGIVFETGFGQTSVLRNGTITRFEGDGVFGNTSGRLVISNISSVGNGTVFGSGLRLHSQGAVVKKSVTAGNSNRGMEILGLGNPVTVSGSTSVRNGDSGIAIEQAVNPRVLGTTVASNGDDGIDISGDRAVVESSRVTGNGDAGTEDGITIAGNEARIEATTSSGNYFEGIHIDGNDAKLLDNKTEGNGWGSADGFGTGMLVAGAGPTGRGNVSRGNEGATVQCSPTTLCTSGAKDVPADKNPVVLTADDCGTQLTDPGRIYTITADIACPANGFGIAEDDITLDLGGHTLRNSDANRIGHGVFVGTGVNKAVVRNGTILRFRDGIQSNSGAEIGRIVASNLALVDMSESAVDVYAPMTFSRSSALTNESTGVAARGGGSKISNSLIGANLGTGLALGNRPVVSRVWSLGNGDGASEYGISVNGDKPQILRSVASGNAQEGVYVTALTVVGATVDESRTEGNGWVSGLGDDPGIRVVDGRAKGRNRSRGNDSPFQCDPGNLC